MFKSHTQGNLHERDLDEFSILKKNAEAAMAVVKENASYVGQKFGMF